MFRLDWASANLNGSTSLSDGSASLDVSVATPQTADCDRWDHGAFPGDDTALASHGVSDPTRVEIAFGAPVEDVCFEIYDLDASCDFDDQITVLARNAAGDLVAIDFSDLADHHSASGGTVNADDAASLGVDGPGASDSVSVSIAGPIVSLVILHDNGPTAAQAGTVGLSDLFIGNLAGPALDGLVQGTDQDDLIDAAYAGDPEGDRVDGQDAILQGAAPNDDVILAGTGNDTILAGDGDDDVSGGAGNDDINGGAGDDLLSGEDGNDTIEGQSGDDIILGGDGDDLILDEEGSETVEAGEGDDVINVGTLGAPDRGYPGLFAADLDPNDDRDFVDGDLGDDTISTGDDADTINAGGGNDVVDGGFDDDQIDAGAGADSVLGGEGSDTILGGSGNDTLFGGLGLPDDPLNIPDDGSGSFGADLVTDNGRDLIDGGSGDDLIFGEDDADTLLGGAGNDTLDGGVDDDDLDGGAGDDLLRGGQGDDSLEGGAGDDTLIGGDGDDTLQGGAGNDLFELADDDGGRDLALGGDDRDTFRVAQAGDEAVLGGEGGDDFDTLDLRGAGPLRVNFSNNDPATESGTVDFFDADGNVSDTLTFGEIEQVIPCFTPGSVVATTRGEVFVEELQPGDKVLTRDNGAQTVEWVGQKLVTGTQMAAMPQMRPILIKAGSLGDGLPRHDMMVSPNHRMLIARDENALYFEEREVLVAAKHLVDGRKVARAGVEGATYIHFMCARHEVVLCDGAWTESFQPGDNSLAGLDRDQRNEIFTLFPELATHEGQGEYTAARKALKKHEAMLLTI